MAAFSQLSICRPPPLRSGGNFIKDAEYAVFFIIFPILLSTFRSFHKVFTNPDLPASLGLFLHSGGYHATSKYIFFSNGQINRNRLK